MKKLTLIALLVSAFATFALAAPIRTSIILPTDPLLVINVPANQVLHILNFVHNGQAGSVSLTKDGKSSVIMNSIKIDTQEVHRDFVIAGPATVSVGPNDTYLTLPYQLVANE